MLKRVLVCMGRFLQLLKRVRDAQVLQPEAATHVEQVRRCHDD